MIDALLIECIGVALALLIGAAFMLRRPTAPRPPVVWYLATKDAQQHSRTLTDEEQMVRGIARRALENHRQAWLEQEGGDSDQMELS